MHGRMMDWCITAWPYHPCPFHPNNKWHAACTRHASWIWGAGAGTSDIPVLGSGYIAYMAQLGGHQVAAWHVWRL